MEGSGVDDNSLVENPNSPRARDGIIASGKSFLSFRFHFVLSFLFLINRIGYLAKKGGKRTNWNTRWFVLTNTHLIYYSSDEEKKMKGQIPLAGARVGDSSRKPHCFVIYIPERTYYIAAVSSTEKQRWLRLIKALPELEKDPSTAIPLANTPGRKDTIRSSPRVKRMQTMFEKKQ